GTAMNLAIIPHIGDASVFLFYTAALAVGKIFGGKFGAGYACKVDGVLLRRLFGVILVFPLVHILDLGRLWLDPLGTDLLLCTIGDIILWTLIVLPCVILWVYWSKKNPVPQQYHEVVTVEAKGS
ncbi:MAG: hypothetical protein KAR03_06810, partial [Candidatus Thorarchaeota archaeon]|nr:hypothetical protein [Candidatus Thorarchaeota archaeon]